MRPLSLVRSTARARPAALFRPPSLRYAAQRFAALLGTDVAPPGGAKANGRSLNRRRRELSASQIEHFDRQIEQCFGRQATLPHHTAQSCGSARAKEVRQFGGKRYLWILRLLGRFLGT